MENNTEIWKDIVGFEGLYQISNYGNVKSCKRYVKGKFGQRRVNEKLLSLGKDKDGYLMAILCQDATKKTVKIHRLVADAFIDKIDGKNLVNHIDSQKSNNFVNCSINFLFDLICTSFFPMYFNDLANGESFCHIVPSIFNLSSSF